MFKARFTRRDEGGYAAAYGKGNKQLTAILVQAHGKWHVSEGFGAGEIEGAVKIRDVKAGWEALAVSAYSGGSPSQATTPPFQGGPPSLKRPVVPIVKAPPRIGPPTLKVAQGFEAAPIPSNFEQSLRNDTRPIAPTSIPRCDVCGQRISGWEKGEDGTMMPPCRCRVPGPDYSPDPLDPRMYAEDPNTRMRHLTPIGTLDRIFAWARQTGNTELPWIGDLSDVLYRSTGYPEFRPGAINGTTANEAAQIDEQSSVGPAEDGAEGGTDAAG